MTQSWKYVRYGNGIVGDESVSLSVDHYCSICLTVSGSLLLDMSHSQCIQYCSICLTVSGSLLLDMSHCQWIHYCSICLTVSGSTTARLLFLRKTDYSGRFLGSDAVGTNVSEERVASIFRGTEFGSGTFWNDWASGQALVTADGQSAHYVVTLRWIYRLCRYKPLNLSLL